MTTRQPIQQRYNDIEQYIRQGECAAPSNNRMVRWFVTYPQCRHEAYPIEILLAPNKKMLDAKELDPVGWLVVEWLLEGSPRFYLTQQDAYNDTNRIPSTEYTPKDFNDY